MTMDDVFDVTPVGAGTRVFARHGAMMPHNGPGKSLCDRLREELGVPPGVREFSVHFKVDDAVFVRCEYMPAPPKVD